MAKSTKHITGAGKSTVKKTRPKTQPRKPLPKPGPKPNRPKPPAQAEPMPYYPSTGSNRKPNAMPKEDLKDAVIKIWNDRNSNNDGTKLNR